MVRQETFRQKTREKVIPIFNLDTLKQLCLVNGIITYDQSIRACPGLLMVESQTGKKRLIYSVFGLEKIDIVTKERLAVCGFNIEGDCMKITHTPQGKRPNEFSSPRVRNRFGRSNFRVEMMEIMIEIARKLGLKRIEGEPAASFHEVDIGLISYDAALMLKDRLFEKMGFVFNEKKLVYCLNLDENSD